MESYLQDWKLFTDLFKKWLDSALSPFHYLISFPSCLFFSSDLGNFCICNLLKSPWPQWCQFYFNEPDCNCWKRISVHLWGWIALHYIWQESSRTTLLWCSEFTLLEYIKYIYNCWVLRHQTFWTKSKLYIQSTLNIDLILWHPQLIVDAVKC